MEPRSISPQPEVTIFSWLQCLTGQQFWMELYSSLLRMKVALNLRRQNTWLLLKSCVSTISLFFKIRLALFRKMLLSTSMNPFRNLLFRELLQKMHQLYLSAQLKYNIDVVAENPYPGRNFTLPPKMIVIRSFDINKPGSEVDEIKGGVAGGSILQGVLKVNFFLLLQLLGVRTKDTERQGKVSKLAKAEILMLNIGSLSIGARVISVRNVFLKLQLTSPVCTSIGEKIALSRRIDMHWRLIGWGTIEAGVPCPIVGEKRTRD